jgi:hypothetical protein
MSKLLQGTFLILLGCVFLLVNFGYVSWDVVAELAGLWPLLLVAWGISLMTRRTKVSFLGFLGPLILVLALVYVFWGNYRGAARDVETVTVSQELTDIDEARVTLRFAGGKLVVSPGDAMKLVEAEMDYRADTSRPRLIYSEEDDFGRVVLRRTGSTRAGPGMGNRWDVRLTDRIPLELLLVTEGSNCNLDLDGIRVADFEVTAGASNVVVRFGRGYTDAHVRVDAGVSSVRLEIPKQYGLRMLMDCGLCFKYLPDGTKKRAGGGGAYYSENYDTAPYKMDLEVEAGVSKISIEHY